MIHLNFHSCPVDPDVWMRKAIKDDGAKLLLGIRLTLRRRLFMRINEC